MCALYFLCICYLLLSALYIYRLCYENKSIVYLKKIIDKITRIWMLFINLYKNLLEKKY